MLRRKISLAFTLMLCAGGARGEGVVMPMPVPTGEEAADPYSFTGIVSAYEGYGSGAVAADPRVVVSCAHVVFSGEMLNADFMAWTSGNEWFRAWNGAVEPAYGTGELLSGYYYWRGYATAAAATQRIASRGGNVLLAQDREFNLDFVAHFHHSKDLAAGRFAPVVEDGAAWIGDATVDKTITGYPMGRYTERDPLEFRMHATGPFNGALAPESRSLKRYLTAYDLAETGSGNSGGPVWVSKNGGIPAVAAVLVSGQEQAESKRSMIGVHAVSRDGWRLIRSAMSASSSAAPSTGSFSMPGGIIPDYSTLRRTVKVSGLPKTATAVTVDLQINHPFKRDLVVYVRAPGRKTAVIYDGAGDDSPGASVALAAQPVAYFYGINPNGVWTILVDDLEQGDEGSLEAASLHISAR